MDTRKVITTEDYERYFSCDGSGEIDPQGDWLYLDFYDYFLDKNPRLPDYLEDPVKLEDLVNYNESQRVLLVLDYMIGYSESGTYAFIETQPTLIAHVLPALELIGARDVISGFRMLLESVACDLKSRFPETQAFFDTSGAIAWEAVMLSEAGNAVLADNKQVSAFQGNYFNNIMILTADRLCRDSYETQIKRYLTDYILTHLDRFLVIKETG